jgi:hypothetical protein
LGAFIYSVHLCNKYVAQLDKTMLLDFLSTPTLINITDRRSAWHLQIDTAAATSPQPDLPKKQPGRLDLASTSKGNIPAGASFCLATVRVIDDLGVIPYLKAS